jgi:hypothetical protein
MTARKLLALAALAVLTAAAPARAADPLVRASGDFGSGARPGGFDSATSIAVDEAGRVFVADAGAGRVEVFDSVTAGNRYLLSIGEGKLVRPVAVAVDNRNRVYVFDGGRNVIELYESASRKFAPRGTLGEPGQALGQFEGPASMTTDPTQRLFVTEAGNMRVSVFRPARRGGIVFQSAFGIALPEPFSRPVATARDSGGRLYIASAEPKDGGVRAFDRRGRFISPLGGSSPSAPRGVAVDRVDRIVIADTGHDRLLVYGPLQQGAPLLERYSASSLQAPGPAIFAPGAMLYVLSGNRVVRLRFDDADTDGVPDTGDNCLGLANGDQAENDSDGRGDACDDDDDGDGRRDEADRCPTEAASDPDADGCRDPRTRFLVPIQNRPYLTSPARLNGRSDGGQLGIETVEVALGRRLDGLPPTAAGARCAWLDPTSGAFMADSCSRPGWFAAQGRDSWRVRLRPGLLRPGRYVAVARAKQRQGPLEDRLAPGRNLRLFSVGRSG